MNWRPWCGQKQKTIPSFEKYPQPIWAQNKLSYSAEGYPSPESQMPSHSSHKWDGNPNGQGDWSSYGVWQRWHNGSGSEPYSAASSVHGQDSSDEPDWGVEDHFPGCTYYYHEWGDDTNSNDTNSEASYCTNTSYQESSTCDSHDKDVENYHNKRIWEVDVDRNTNWGKDSHGVDDLTSWGPKHQQA